MTIINKKYVLSKLDEITVILQIRQEELFDIINQENDIKRILKKARINMVYGLHRDTETPKRLRQICINIISSIRKYKSVLNSYNKYENKLIEIMENEHN